MDAATIVPLSGFALATVTLVSYFGRAVIVKEQDNRATITAEQERTARAEARTAEALARADAAQREIDVEREKRRDAETAAASVGAQLVAQQQLVRYWASEVRRLQTYLPPPIPPGIIPDPPDEVAP